MAGVISSRAPSPWGRFASCQMSHPNARAAGVCTIAVLSRIASLRFLRKDLQSTKFRATNRGKARTMPGPLPRRCVVQMDLPISYALAVPWAEPSRTVACPAFGLLPLQVRQDAVAGVQNDSCDRRSSHSLTIFGWMPPLNIRLA